MIKLLGIKRAILLGVVMILNLALAGAYVMVFEPMRADAETQLNNVRGEVSNLQGKIDNIKFEMQSLKDNLPRYEALATRGFYGQQDRFDVSRHLEALRGATAVSSFSFTIGDLQQMISTDADAVQKRLVSSRIEIDKVVSSLDIPFYDLLQVVDDVFPAHTRIQSFNVKRTIKLDQGTLENIRKTKMSLIDARMVFDWTTLIDPPPAADAAGTPGAIR